MEPCVRVIGHNHRIMCVFCDDLPAAGELLFEDAHSWVLLHPDWSPRGHVMVVAKRHAQNVSDLYSEEWLHLAAVWQRAERAVLELTGADRAIMLKLGIQTPHLHLHLYPAARDASREDVFAAIDGKRSEARDDHFVTSLCERLT